MYGDPRATTPGEPMGWAPGARVGEFVLQARLGGGGMGEVWLAELPGSQVQRALKVLRGVDDPELRLRFAREGEAQARVDAHPNVLRVHAAGVHQGAPYLVLELARGGDLAQRLEAGPLPPLEAARLVRDLARGLAHAHARGVLHRDLKPQNVLFGERGEPKLVDFGLARLAGADSLTASSEVLGTPAYLAPEQATGRSDERTDVYGLGTILYQSLTGRPPFTGRGALQVLEAVMHQPPPRPGSLVPGIPPPLEALCLACLAKEPEGRPQRAEALAETLDRLLEGGDLHGAGPPRRLRLLGAGALIAGALAAGALGLAALRLGGPPATPPDETVAAVPPPPPALSADAPPPSERWEDDRRASPRAGGAATRGRWGERMRAELRTPLVVDGYTQGRLATLHHGAEQAFKRRGDLGPLREVARQGYIEGRLELALLLLRDATRERLSLDRAAAEGEAAEWLWQAVRDGGGQPRSAYRLQRLLMEGGALGGYEVDPEAIDALLEWVGRCAATATWKWEDRLMFARLYLEREGPADLLAGLGALRDVLTSGGERDREEALQDLRERARKSSAMTFALAAAELEGWIEADAAARERALQALEHVGWRALVPRYLAARAFASAPGAAHERLPGPLDVLALDGGRSVRRPSAQLLFVERDPLGPGAGAPDGQRLRDLAAIGDASAQWDLVRWIRGKRLTAEDPQAAARWVALAALDGVPAPDAPLGSTGTVLCNTSAVLEVGRELLLGGLGEGVEARLAVPFLRTAAARIDDVRRLEAQAWLGLLELRGEGLPRDEAHGREWVREALADRRVGETLRLFERDRPRARELLASYRAL